MRQHGWGVAGVAMMAVLGTGAGRALADVPPAEMQVQSREMASSAAAAEIKGNPRAALRLADQALAVDARNPWAHYDRATALWQLGYTDDAVQAFRTAELLFPANERWGRSISIYGRALALAQAGRCGAAQVQFAEYAAYVESYDPTSAAMARRYADDCIP